MPTGTSSGADTSSGGTAKSREHNQGNQDRSYTLEQKTAVLRVRKCSPTAFYDILGLESVKKTVTESEIKKAYRKLSLLTHPDKNGHEYADEAFKMVSRAFGVLSDTDKKAKYDRFGGDPDSRFGGGGGSTPQQNPFSGFSNRQQSARGGGGPGFEEEISPEEMFNRFFGGGFGGFGGGMFDGGPQYVFNMGGGPGFRVHQFGGPRPRRRPRDPAAPEEATTLRSTMMNILPLLILFVLPLLSSLFSGSDSTSSGPSMRFDAPVPPHTLHRETHRLKVDYFLNPIEVESYTPQKLSQLDKKAETTYVQQLRLSCESEHDARNRMIDAAQGWFVQDQGLMQQARDMEMRNCRKLETLGLSRTY